MSTVYFDVENTLNVPFITGIQRVTRELSNVLLNSQSEELRSKYVPIIYDHEHTFWRRLNRREQKNLVLLQPRSITLGSRIIGKLRSIINRNHALRLKELEPNSVFLDIDSSWHSDYKRSECLPKLRRAGVKVVKLHYDIIPILFPQTTHPKTKEVFQDHFISHLKYADLFLCISETTKADVEHYCKQRNLRSPLLQTITLGSKINRGLSKTGSTANSEHSYGKYILSVGTLEPRKNYSALIAAFDLLKDRTSLNLVIVGKTGWLSEEINSKLHTHPDYNQRVFHFADASDTQLENLYRNAWLCVIPSMYEGFGLPVVEALAHNCPVICSDAGSLPEVGGEHVKLFSPNSPAEICATICHLFDNPEAYRELKKQASTHKTSSWEATALQLDQAITNLNL